MKRTCNEKGNFNDVGSCDVGLGPVNVKMDTT